jgi:hypothetical protein
MKERNRHARARTHTLRFLSDLRILRQTFCVVVLCDIFVNNLPLNEVHVLYITEYNLKILYRHHVVTADWQARFDVKRIRTV